MAALPRIPGVRASTLVAGALLTIPSTLGVVLTRQINAARRNAFLPRPDYRIDITVAPPWATGEPLSVAFLGDSLVEGVGAPRPSQSLPAQTAFRLAAHLGRPIRMRGYGIASSRIDQVLTEQVPLLDDDTDLVLVLIGANDATHGTAPWDFARRVEQLALDAHERTGGAPVVFTGLPEIEAAPLLSRPLRDIAAAMGDTLHSVQRRLAVRLPQARYIDVRQEVGDTVRHRGKELFAADHYHPNPAGYALLGEATARCVARMLADEGPVVPAFTAEEMRQIHRDAWAEIAAIPGVDRRRSPDQPQAVHGRRATDVTLPDLPAAPAAPEVAEVAEAA